MLVFFVHCVYLYSHIYNRDGIKPNPRLFINSKEIESSDPYLPRNPNRPLYWELTGITQKEIIEHTAEWIKKLFESNIDSNVIIAGKITPAHFLYSLIKNFFDDEMPEKYIADSFDHPGVYWIFLSDDNDSNFPAFYWGNWNYRETFPDECNASTEVYEGFQKIEGIKMNPITDAKATGGVRHHRNLAIRTHLGKLVVKKK
jgi:hypothetical protein